MKDKIVIGCLAGLLLVGAVLFSRQQAPSNPRTNAVGLLSTFFVRSGDKYKMSEAPTESVFGQIPPLLGFTDVYYSVSFIGNYETFRKNISTAPVPKSFYECE